MIFQSLKMAWSAIVSNKMRSFLTMLGIIIGVVSLVVLVSVVNGATSSVTDSISQMGTNLLTVSISDDKDKPLNWEEVAAFADEEEFAAAAPMAQGNFTAKNGTESDIISVTGTTPGYSEIQDLTVSAGRFLKKADVENSTYVTVVNQYTATTLFGSSNVVGEKVSINGIKFQIVGVLEEEESSISGLNSESMEAYIPYSTMIRLSDNVKYVTTFYLTASSEDETDTAEASITSTLLKRFNYDEDAFSVQNMSTLMETMASVTGTLSIMLGGIAAISLLVGGIGIMNIMLVSVTERTREIGIRKAIGAGYGDIMLQFLIEALVISLLGCAFGIVASGAIIFVVGKIVTSMSFTISSGAVWVSVVFSAFVGIAFGSYPANKAAKKKPIDALRFS